MLLISYGLVAFSVYYVINGWGVRKISILNSSPCKVFKGFSPSRSTHLQGLKKVISGVWEIFIVQYGKNYILLRKAFASFLA